MFLFFIVWFAAWSLIFLYNVDTEAFFILGIIYNILNCIMLRYRLKFNFVRMIFGLFIINLPLSFKNIFGGSYSELPLSYYNICFFMLILYFLFSNFYHRDFKINRVGLVAIISAIYVFIPVLKSSNIILGFKELIDYLMFFILIIVWNNIYEKKENIINYLNLYVTVAVGVAIAVIYQASMLKSGVYLGNTVIFGGSRYASGYIFSDYSFLALYLVTPIFLVFSINMSSFWRISTVLILFLGSFMTSARTGIVALFIALFLFLFVYTATNFSKNPLKVIGLFLAIIISLMLGVIFSNYFRSDGFLSGSGREEGYIVALNQWLENPLFGIGFDISKFIALNNTTIPHNIFIELLLMGGILLLSLFILINLAILIGIYKDEKMYFWTLLLVYTGAQFIPSILSSRFLLVLLSIFLLVSISKIKNEDAKLT